MQNKIIATTIISLLFITGAWAQGYPDSVIATIPVGNGPWGLAITPDGRYVYVANRYSNNISVIRTSDNAVIQTIPLESNPFDVVASPNGNRIYVSCIGNGKVYGIRPSDNVVKDTIVVEQFPHGLAITPNGNYLYVTHWSRNRISVIQTSNNSILDTIYISNHPAYADVTPNGEYLYVSIAHSDNVSVFRTSDNTLKKSIIVEDYPNYIAVTPNGNFVYVANCWGNSVSVIRTSDDTVVKTIPLSGNPCGISITPDGNYTYVTTRTNRLVLIIRTSDNSVVGSVPVGNTPCAIAISPSGSSVYVTNTGDNSVSVIGWSMSQSNARNVVSLSPDPNPVVSEIMQGGVFHRYYKTVDSLNNDTPHAWVKAVFGNDTAYFISGNDAIVDINFSTSAYQPGSTVNGSIIEVSGRPITPIEFEVEILERRYDRTLALDGKLEVAGEFLAGLSVMLDAPKQICLSGTNSNPDSLKVNIRLARGVSGGVGGAIGAELSVNDINLGAVARGDLYAGGAIFTEGKFRFPNPVPSQSDLDKAALFLMIEPEALVPVSQVLVPIAQFLSVFIQTPLTNSVEKGVVGYDIFGGGEGRAAVGLTHSNLPAGDLGGFGAQAQADATMHANLGFVKLPGTGFGVEGGAHGYVAAYGSADYNFAPNPWNRNIVKDLPADLGIYNWRTGSGQFLFEGMLDCGFGIYCDWQGPKAFMVYLTKEIGNNTETYEFWIDSDNIQRLRDFVAGISQDLLAGTINQLGLQNNVMNIFHARPETFAKSFYAVFERVIDFAQSGQGLRLTYYKYNSNSQDILPIRINLAVGLGIDAAIGLNWSIRNEKSLLTEEGTMLIGKKYKLYDYSDDIYTQTRNDVNTVPIQLAVQVLTGLLDDIFGVVAGIMPSKDGDSLILQVGTGTLVVRQGAIPPGDSVAIVSWVWQPETTADCYASKLRKFLQQQAGLTYGIGGFYQLQPEVANVNGKAKLKIAYADSEVVNIDESSLRLYRWNDSLRKWLYVGGVVHPDSNYVVKDSLMLFGLYTLAPAAPSDTFNLHLDPDSIPANGTSYSNATGGPIRLNTGQIVPDSTLITVTTSAGTITTPDADTTIPGIQVLTNNGNISFQIRAPNIATTSTVIARSVEGDAVGSAKIVFYDVARPSTPIISEAYASDSIMVRISWRRNNENDILGYKLYYDSDSLLPYQGHSPYDLPSPIDVGNDTTRILALPLHPDSNFYIRITAYDISRNESDYSEMVWVSGMQVFDTIAPSTPELIAPRPNSAVNDSLPRFVWRRPSDNLTGVSHYLLHYYNNFGIDTTIRINDTSAIPVIPLPDTIYFWQVKAFDWANNPSEWSEVWRFEIDTRGPTRPSLINPHNDTCLNHLNIAFEWTAVTGLGKERRNQPTALPMQLQKKIITEQKMDMIKTTDEMKFNDLIGPKMNDQTQITNMMKVFEASEVRYILEIDTNRLFTSPIFIETTAITYDTVNLFEDRFYWRVRAYDLAGNQGEFSDTFTFIADTTKPVVPILIYPTNNAPIRDTFVWHRATDNLSGIKGYRIQIAYDSLFNRLMLDSTLNNPNDTMIIFHPDSAGYWRVKSIDRAGNESNWSERRGYTGITEGEKKTMPLPSVFILYANQPNPFAKMTEIRYGIPIKTRLRITVYNSSGQEIATLINGIQSPGWYSVKWNGKDNKGNNCPAGIYFYRIESEEYKATKKMVKNE